MAKKKTRKQKSKAISVPLPETIKAKPVATPHATATVGTATPESIAAAQSSFAEEYRYVFRDLKQIGILAAAMFALLIILALVLG